MGFKEIIMNNIQAATKIQSLIRGDLKRKTIRQNSETQPKSFSKLPDGTLVKTCSFLGLNDRLSLGLILKQFSPLGTGSIQTQSLGTAALQQLATDEAIQWINEQLKSPDLSPFTLENKIRNKKLSIPDHISVKITKNILEKMAINYSIQYLLSSINQLR